MKWSAADKLALHRGICRGLFPARISDLPRDRRVIDAYWNNLSASAKVALVPVEAWTRDDLEALEHGGRHLRERDYTMDVRREYRELLEGSGVLAEVCDALDTAPAAERARMEADAARRAEEERERRREEEDRRKCEEASARRDLFGDNWRRLTDLLNAMEILNGTPDEERLGLAGSAHLAEREVARRQMGLFVGHSMYSPEQWREYGASLTESARELIRQGRDILARVDWVR